jgi:hypothetical protein
MRSIIFTVGDLDRDGTESELSVTIECEPDDIKLTTIELYDPEMVRADRPLRANMRWPTVGDDGEDRGYYIESRSQFIRYCESFGLEYDTIEA